MKTVLVACLLAPCFAAQAQQTPGKSIPEYTTKRGTAIHVGDTLLFGMGQRENGSYKYAEIPPNILITSGMSLPASYVNKKVIVQAIKEQTAKNGLNKQVLIVFKAGVYNARLDSDAAEENGELLTKNSPKKPSSVGVGASVADELLKLKNLLDSGAITQAEFDTQKAKILAK